MSENNDNIHKNCYELNFKYYEVLMNLSVKYEAKINTSINALNCSVAIWAIAAAILFNTPPLSFAWILLYIVFSILLAVIIYLGWKKGFSSTEFKEFNFFLLDSDTNEKFLKNEEQNSAYDKISEELLKSSQDLEKNLGDRKKCIDSCNALSKYALYLSALLIFIAIIGRIYKDYEFDIKTRNSLPLNCYDENITNTGASNDTEKTEQ